MLLAPEIDHFLDLLVAVVQHRLLYTGLCGRFWGQRFRFLHGMSCRPRTQVPTKGVPVRKSLKPKPSTRIINSKPKTQISACPNVCAWIITL